MTEKLLCRTLEPELNRLKSIFCENKIKHFWKLKPPASNDGSCFCIYEIFVKEDDIKKAGELLSDDGYAVWVGK